MLGRVLVVVLTRRSYQIGYIPYRCRGSSRPATVLGYSYNCQTAVCTDTCPNQRMKFCPCNGVMHRLGSSFRTRKTCSKRASLPPNKDGGFVATENHVIVTWCRPAEMFSAKRLLKGTKFVVTENLTRRRNDLLKKVRSLDTVSCAWTTDGRIVCLLEDGRKVTVLHERDVDTLSSGR